MPVSVLVTSLRADVVEIGNSFAGKSERGGIPVRLLQKAVLNPRASVAGKLFRVDVVIADSGLMDHRVEALNHLRRPSYVVDGRDGIRQIP